MPTTSVHSATLGVPVYFNFHSIPATLHDATALHVSKAISIVATLPLVALTNTVKFTTETYPKTTFLFALTSFLKFIEYASEKVGFYTNSNLLQDSTEVVVKVGVDTATDIATGTIKGLAQSALESAKHFGSNAKTRWDEGLNRPFQNKDEQKMLMHAQFDGECVRDRTCHEQIINQGPSSSSFILPTIFLLGTLGLCAYAYQLLTKEAEPSSKKIQETSKPAASKA